MHRWVLVELCNQLQQRRLANAFLELMVDIDDANLFAGAPLVRT